jgi:hypothetical protein
VSSETPSAIHNQASVILRAASLLPRQPSEGFPSDCYIKALKQVKRASSWNSRTTSLPSPDVDWRYFFGPFLIVLAGLTAWTVAGKLGPWANEVHTRF